MAAGVASSGHGPTKESQSKGEGEQGGSGADKGQHDDGKQGSEGGKDGQAIAAVTATHGNESSFETIVSLGPRLHLRDGPRRRHRHRGCPARPGDITVPSVPVTSLSGCG